MNDFSLGKFTKTSILRETEVHSYKSFECKKGDFFIIIEKIKFKTAGGSFLYKVITRFGVMFIHEYYVINHSKVLTTKKGIK